MQKRISILKQLNQIFFIPTENFRRIFSCLGRAESSHGTCSYERNLFIVGDTTGTEKAVDPTRVGRRSLFGSELHDPVICRRRLSFDYKVNSEWTLAVWICYKDNGGKTNVLSGTRIYFLSAGVKGCSA